MAVKNYILENSRQYNEAVKRTGPIDNTTLYRRSKAMKGREEQTIIYSIDDPYWQEFLIKNTGR